MSKGAQIFCGATAIALLVGWYASSNVERASTFAYYQSLDELRASGAFESDVRVHGYVAAGSIERDVPSRQVQFAVQNDPPHAQGVALDPLAVVFEGLETPDLFKDGAEVVLEGRLSGGDNAVFRAEKIFAKCPSKFEATAVTGTES